MDLLPKSETLKYGFVVFATLVSIHLWSLQLVPDIIWTLLEAATIAMFIVIVLWNSYIFTKVGLLSRTGVLLLIFLPFLSAVGAYIYHHQGFLLSLSLLRNNFFWLFYFVLHIFNIEKKKIIKFMIFVGCVWGFFTIVQQFTYPHIYFFSKGDDDGGEGEDSTIYRAGVYRFLMWGQQFNLFILLYFLYKYLTTKSYRKIRCIPFILFAILGFYYYGTRQYALAAAMSMSVAILLLKPGPRGKYIALAIPSVALLWALKNILFGQFIDLTNQQGQYGWDQDVRFLSAKFWLFDYWPHWTAMLLGNGPPHMLSDYGRENALIVGYFHFYRSDVGMIGAFNKYGIFYVITVFWIIWRMIRLRGLSYSNKYLKLFFYNALFLSLLSDAFAKGMGFFCFIMYLIDKSVEEQKQEEVVLEENLYATPELDYT